MANIYYYPNIILTLFLVANYDVMVSSPVESFSVN
jgi:hypothetical protein